VTPDFEFNDMQSVQTPDAGIKPAGVHQFSADVHAILNLEMLA
jgi:hypothetical protein